MVVTEFHDGLWPSGFGPVECSPSELAALWQGVQVTVQCARPRHFEEAPGFGDRLRGGFGRAVRKAAEEAPAGPAATLWRTCFDPLPLASGGWEPIRPFAISGVSTPDGLLVRLVLFGAMRRHAGLAARLLVESLHAGIALRAAGPARVSLPIRVATAHWIEGIALPPVPDRAILHFETPLSIRRRGRSARDAKRLPASFAPRVGALAPWMGLRLKTLPEPALAVDDADLRLVRWQRHSIRHPGKVLPMEGLIGRVELAGDLSFAWPLLVLGTIAHAGSMTAFGLGRYALAGVDENEVLRGRLLALSELP